MPATDVTGVAAPLGIPLPLWQQPVFFVFGALVVVLAIGLRRDQPLPGLMPTATGASLRPANQRT